MSLPQVTGFHIHLLSSNMGFHQQVLINPPWGILPSYVSFLKYLERLFPRLLCATKVYGNFLRFFEAVINTAAVSLQIIQYLLSSNLGFHQQVLMNPPWGILPSYVLFLKYLERLYLRLQCATKVYGNFLRFFEAVINTAAVSLQIIQYLYGHLVHSYIY